MRKVNIFRLPRIDGPLYFALGGHIAFDELLLRNGGAHWRRMTPRAFLQSRNAGERSVRTDFMAVLAFHARRCGVDLMTESDRLRLTLINDARKAGPTRAQRQQRPGP